MATYERLPEQFEDTKGRPYSGGELYIGVYGMDPVTNPITVYGDEDLTVPLAQPIILDTHGRPASDIYLSGDYSYRLNDISGTQQELKNRRSADSTEINQGIIYDLRNYDCACDYNPNTGTGTDDTAALQAALDAISVPTIGNDGQWYDTVVPGGVTIRVPGFLKITDTIRCPGGIVFEADTPLKGGFFFDPASAKTMIVGDSGSYTRSSNSTWSRIGFRGCSFLSTLFDSPYLQNIAIDMANVNGYWTENCRFEGWGTAVEESGICYYAQHTEAEFYNNLIHFDQQTGGGPTTFNGGVMWNYETDWASNPVKPSELMKVFKAVHLNGLSLEPRTAVEDATTFCCIRDAASAAISGDVYVESNYPIVGDWDHTKRYKAHNLRTYHDNGRTLIRFENFDLDDESISANDQWSAPVKTGWGGGILTDLNPNPFLELEDYGYVIGSVASYQSGVQTPFGSNGVLQADFTSTTPAQSPFRLDLTAAQLAKYEGQRLYFGAIVNYTDLDVFRFQVQENPLVTFKFTDKPKIDYGPDASGDNWALYVVSYQVPASGANDIQVRCNANPSNTSTSQTRCAGIFVWANGLDEIPVPRYKPPTFVQVFSEIPDISTSDTIRIPIGVDGIVTRVDTVLEGAITVADATISLRQSNLNPMAQITVAYLGSGAGTMDSDTSITNAAVTAGSHVLLQTDGGSTTAQRLWVMITIKVANPPSA